MQPYLLRCEIHHALADVKCLRARAEKGEYADQASDVEDDESRRSTEHFGQLAKCRHS